MRQYKSVTITFIARVVGIEDFNSMIHRNKCYMDMLDVSNSRYRLSILKMIRLSFSASSNYWGQPQNDNLIKILVIMTVIMDNFAVPVLCIFARIGHALCSIRHFFERYALVLCKCIWPRVHYLFNSWISC